MKSRIKTRIICCFTVWATFTSCFSLIRRLLLGNDIVLRLEQTLKAALLVLRLLVDGAAKGPDYPYTARTEGNLLVCVRGENIQIGEFIQAEIEKTSLRCLFAVKKS